MLGAKKIDDDRFKHIATDPRFRGVPKSQRKVKIDKRFTGMFDDKRFKLKYVMDKRGRPIHHTTSEDLKKYYEVSSSDDESPEGQEVDVGECSSAKKKASTSTSKAACDEGASRSDVGDLERPVVDDAPNEETAESEGDESDGEETDDSSQDESCRVQEPDLSRGVGNIETSSDEDDSDDESGSESGQDVGWGELDRDAPQSDATSRRLALCNLDWDKLKAQDLFVLLHSFKPPEGVVRSVTIYPTQFGKERMAEESVRGPSQLLAERARKERLRHENGIKNTGGDEEEEGTDFDREALRKYQVDRLRYYFAVAECDTADTADHLYRELDGREYESSGTCLDLRFIPDDMTFDDEPSSQADCLPDPSSYTPLNFVTTALQSVKVELTWDEDNPRRSQAIQRAFQEDTDAIADDLKVYLASSSSEDEDDTKTNDGAGKKQSAEAQIQKYRDLLKSLDGDEKPVDNDKDDVQMEVTWNPDLHKRVEDMVKRKQEQPEGQTPFEEFLQKRKEKHKQKKSLKKGSQVAEEEKETITEEDDGQAFSDDDLPSDVADDEFFQKELREQNAKVSSKGKMAGKGTKRKAACQPAAGEGEEALSKQAELELLLMDEEDGKQHFSLKKLLDENRTVKGKKKRKLERKRNAAETLSNLKPADTFEVNLADPRFSALYDSHHFSVDPTDPHFKKTKGMDALLNEKQKRRQAKPDGPAKQVKQAEHQTPKTQGTEEPEPKPTQPSLSSLANAVKLKVERMKNRTKK